MNPPRIDADTRIPTDPAVDRLRDYVNRAPGCTLREAGQATFLGRARLHEAVNALVTSGDLYLGQASRSIHLLPHVAGIETCWRQVVALRNGLTNQIYARLWLQAPTTQAELVRFAAHTWGASRGLVEGHLAVLKKAGLLKTETAAGRRPVYRPGRLKAPAMRVLTKHAAVPGPASSESPERGS